MNRSERLWIVFSALFALILTLTIVVDVIVRNVHVLSVYVHNSALHSFLSSTVLQELEWHIHAILVGICVMYGIVANSNVRIDVFSANWSETVIRRIERIGWLVLATPFCVILSVYLLEITRFSYVVNETSTASAGIPYRWAIKGIFTGLFIGTTVLVLREVYRSFRR